MEKMIKVHTLHHIAKVKHLKEIFIAWDQLDECYLRTYSPLGEYGGWGIKYGLGGAGKVYNVSGNQGLQLVFKDGARLLIGTKKPQELQRGARSSPPNFRCWWG